MKAARMRPAAALIALAGVLGLLWLQDFGTHTDDGCQVEIHCLACRAAVVRPTSARAHVDPTPVLVALCQAPIAPSPFVADVCRASGPTRGPPSPSL